MRLKETQAGFSVVELMVALLLGLFLMGGVTGMYVSGKQTYRMTDNLSRLQESMRFSLDFISQDIRMAGYTPCRVTPLVNNVINGSGASWFLDYFNFGIRGFEGGVDVIPVASAATNSDAVVIMKASNFNSTLDFSGVTLGHDPAANLFTLSNGFSNSDFERGRIAIACDPRQAAMFQILDANAGTQTISYGVSTNIIPGNSTTSIGTFGEDAIVASYKPVIYFIRQSTHNPNVNSLWRSNLEAVGPPAGINTAQMGAEELLEGIESMQILYGEDASATKDQIVDRFVTANNVTDWQDVVSVRMGILMATGEEVTAQVDTNSYNIAGTMVAAPGTDKKLRYAVNTTINIRNRIQE